ncbi:MAG: excinuclease ABC subunit UvrB [Campylobacterales bacterium]
MIQLTLVSDFQLCGDQPQAVATLTDSIRRGERYQTLIGVTGSGKTFTMANIINNLKMPTLIMTHNKTLAAQLFSEFKGFFPHNHVEYFISYYDYYQPEAYIPRQDLFIEKDSSINAELERLRLSATASLLEYDDVIIVASVSAIYGLGDPLEYKSQIVSLEVGQPFRQQELLRRLVDMGYTRNDAYFDRGNFRVFGEIVDIFPAYYEEHALRLEFFGDEIERLYFFDHLTGEKIAEEKRVNLYAANQFVVGKERLAQALQAISDELDERLKFFEKEGKVVEYQRLKQRVEFDLEMIETTGTCKGIENYARFMTGKAPGETPYSLLDYFEIKGKPYLVIVDESHVSLPQFRGMYEGDRSRKEVLVEYGFRLPSALDNRPLKFHEFINKAPHYLFVSATPAPLELELSQTVAHQVIRPTGLLDPEIEVVACDRQVEHFYDESKKRIAMGDKVLATVLTIKMAEELARYYADLGIKVKYMHSEIDAVERTEIIRGLRSGQFDMLIGINLLREGLDLPEVSLIGIFDADKEGFLRSETSLIQTMGRAARNERGKVILYANKITGSMERAIAITKQRRAIQEAYNKEHGITPRSTTRKFDESLKISQPTDEMVTISKAKAAKMPKSERDTLIKELTKKMHEAAKNLEFEEAAKLRDQIAKIRTL